MAMQLKTGADLNNMPLSRFVIENLIADPTNNIKAGSKYFNTGTGALANRERIYAGGKWRSTAYMDDIDALQKQLDELDFAGSEEFQSLSGRVLTIEGLFNNGKAKDAEKLGGQLPSYYAEAEIVERLREDFDDLYKTLNDDTTGVINTWQEVVDFVNEYSGSEDLSTILAAMNADIAKRALQSEVDAAFATVNGNVSSIGTKVGSLETLTANHTNQIADRYTKAESDGRYLPLDGTKAMSGILEAPKGIKIGNVTISIDNDGNLKIDGNAYATGELGSGQVAGEGGGGAGGGYTAFDDSVTWADYDDSMADWLLTAYHGKLFNDRIATLENKATKVEVSNLLTSGTKIATIKVDANSYDILAPSTDWSAITNKPTTIGGYGITDAIVYNKDGIDISGDTMPLNEIGYGYQSKGWIGNGVAFSIGLSQNYWMNLQYNSAYQGLARRVCVNGTINDWANILDEKNYKYFLDTVYLKQSGGTIMGPLSVSSEWPMIVFIQNGVRGESIGMNHGKLVCYNTAGTSSYEILHLNNYADYAAKTDGSNASGTWGIDISGSAKYLVALHRDTLGAENVFKIITGKIYAAYGIPYNQDGMFPSTNYGNAVIGIPRSTDGGGAFLGISNNGNIYYRTTLNTDWKTIAFTDSDITGNAASAYKLIMSNGTTIVSVDDNGTTSFAGMLALASDLSFTNAGQGLRWKVGEDSIANIVVGATGNFLLGNQGAKAGYNTYLDGNNIFLRYGQSGNIAMSISSTGNITFNGSIIANGDSVVFKNGSVVYWKDTSNTNKNILTYNSSKLLAIGYDLTEVGNITGLYGNTIKLFAGESRSLAMTITSGGRFLLGSSQIDGGATVNISGRIHVNGAAANIALGANPSAGISTGEANGYGTTIWVSGNGQGNIQSMRYDGSTTSYALNLNPLGGNVNIASADAITNVLGTMTVEKAVTLKATATIEGGVLSLGAFNGTGSATMYFNRNNINYIWANNEGGFFAIGVKDKGATSPSNASLAINATSVVGGYRNNEVSLGLANYRWSDVYSVKGNFSSRVFIGDVVDDGSSALQLYGDISAHSTNINFKSTGSWARGLYALDPNGNRLGGIGFYAYGDVLDRIWIGSSFDNPWIAINSTEANFNILTKFNSSVKIGEATLSYENGALKVDKNFFAEGEVASGKVAAEGTGGNTPSGSGLEIKTFDIASTTENQMVELSHNLGTRDVVVQIFENSQSSNYQQVFADVYYVDTAKVAINFGAAQTVPHRVIIMG